eukprot:4924835-Prymnesium_polylepis.1
MSDVARVMAAMPRSDGLSTPSRVRVVRDTNTVHGLTAHRSPDTRRCPAACGRPGEAKPKSFDT